MAKLYFYYSAMYSGKTTSLIQSAHNYEIKNMIPVVLKPNIDDREGVEPKVVNRTGMEYPATIVDCTDISSMIDACDDIKKAGVDVVLVDEVQFLSVEHIRCLEELVDHSNIPVLCFGLRNSFNGGGFPGSDYLLQHADKLVEMKGICHCGKKATHNLMVVDDVPFYGSDDPIKVGDIGLYHSVCRKHFTLGEYQ